MNYKQQKEKARQQAMEWQIWACDECLSIMELATWACYFEKLGKRYGLLKEFKENGIC